MPDRNLELASLVHSMNARSTSIIEQLKAKIAAAPDSTHIELRSEGVVNLIWLLEVQTTLVSKLTEENASIHDQLDGLIRTYLEKE